MYDIFYVDVIPRRLAIAEHFNGRSFQDFVHPDPNHTLRIQHGLSWAVSIPDPVNIILKTRALLKIGQELFYRILGNAIGIAWMWLVCFQNQPAVMTVNSATR